MSKKWVQRQSGSKSNAQYRLLDLFLPGEQRSRCCTVLEGRVNNKKKTLQAQWGNLLLPEGEGATLEMGPAVRNFKGRVKANACGGEDVGGMPRHLFCGNKKLSLR